MLRYFANMQTLVIGIILLWGGIWKVFIPKSREIAIRSALLLLFQRKRTTQVIYWLVGTAEIAVGILLLLPPYQWWEMRVASGFAIMFMVYLLFSMKVAPDRPCACVGGRETAISWRTLLRAGLVLVLSIAGWAAEHFWLIAIVASPWSLSLVAVEAFLFVGLSPEVGWTWIKGVAPEDRVHQVQIEPDCAIAPVPLSETMKQLQGSGPFQEISGLLTSKLLEHWREGCWRFLCFEAKYEGCKATAVFAVPILLQPHRVRAVIVNEANNTVLLRVGPSEQSHHNTITVSPSHE